MPETHVNAQQMQAMIGRGGRNLGDAHRQFPIISRNRRTQMEVVQHQLGPRQRRGSVTNFHMHGNALGAITHTDRNGNTYRMNARDHSQNTRGLTYQAHGRGG